MTAAYLRVSTRGPSVSLQRDAIERASRQRGARISVWYSEKAGGAVRARPELERLRAAVRAGEFDRVFVYRLDRLSRGGIRDTLAIVAEFREHGCKIETVADGFSLEGPGADVVLAVLAWAAQMERAAIGERIAAARVRIESDGGTWGRPPRLSAAEIAKCLSLSKAGRTVRQIAVALKIPKSTVGRVVSQNGAYKSTLREAWK
jgi:DNA invertase Pin-like site-specific DNA recombinase